MLGKAARFASTLAVTLLLVTLAVADGHAQGTTGKIQGRVISSAGTPIASAQVTVDGTNLGNITNDDGFYFINQVPAGLYTIRAQSIGFRTVTLTQQRVLAGQTATLNFTLEQAAVELEALVVTGERNPLVPRDQVSSKAIVTGETIDQLPLDNASSIILLQPGVIETNRGFSIRGSREGEEAVYVDGVPLRNLRTGATTNLELGTNSLAQVDVTTGGIAARFGNAQSGVINYVTRTGGTKLGGTVSFQTGALAPKEIAQQFFRGELSVGGPLLMNNLSFFLGLTAEGRPYANQTQGVNDITRWVPSGVDTVIRMARTSAGAPGGADSVDIAIPNFVEWTGGASYPSSVSDEYNLTAKMSYGVGQGSKLDLTYYRNRDQSLGGGIYNPDSWTGSYSTQNTLTLGGYFLLAQSSERALALDVKASLQSDWGQSGAVTQDYLEGHKYPFMGFNFKPVDFITNADDWGVNETLINASRSGILPDSLNQIYPNRSELGTRQGVEGVATNLRINPYADRSGYSIQGLGNVTESWSKESRVYLSATADWQVNRFNRVLIGGELTKADSKQRSMPLYTGRTAPQMFEPTVAGLFVQDRLDIGDVVLEGGLRMDYYDPAGDFPRIPGYVFNVPDSLTKDLYRLRPADASNPDQDFFSRVYNEGDCGGAATAASRTNANGEVVCKNNFVDAKSRTLISPKLAVSFPVTATSTFRLSYGQNAQAPRLVGSGGLLQSQYNDLAGGNANTNTVYGRDVEIPNTVLFEAGYRQVFGGNTVIDVAAYSKTNRNALAYRKIQYEDPNTGAPIFINSLQNADYSLTRGADVRFDRRLSEIADLNLSYSFVDARGTGSDPQTYTALILRRNTNLSVLTGQPVEAPEVLQTLDQSRAHSLSGTLSANFGSDYAEDNTIAHAILADFGIFATLRVASGLPYTRLVNEGNGQTGPPTVAGNAGRLAEQINASRTPMEKRFDLRFTKGFEVMGKGARLFADFRNPLNLENTNSLWLETGTVTNNVVRDKYLFDRLTATTLDGDSNIDDFDIRSEANERTNPVNLYMLLEAEKRFGDGNGVFTADEQRTMYLHQYNAGNAPSIRFRESDRALRLGFELVF